VQRKENKTNMFQFVIGIIDCRGWVNLSRYLHNLFPNRETSCFSCLKLSIKDVKLNFFPNKCYIKDMNDNYRALVMGYKEGYLFVN
jgi:hypothetical protein